RESSSTSLVRLEQSRCPFGTFGFQARHDRLFAILDLPAIGANIVGLVEKLLKIERYVEIARRKGDGDLGELLRESDRIHKKLLGSNGAMDRDEVIERAGLGHDEIPGNG